MAGEANLRLLGVASAGAALVSLGLDLIQTFTPLGTAGDRTDILLNTGGCVLAAGVGIVIRRALTDASRTTGVGHR